MKGVDSIEMTSSNVGSKKKDFRVMDLANFRQSSSNSLIIAGANENHSTIASRIGLIENLNIKRNLK